MIPIATAKLSEWEIIEDAGSSVVIDEANNTVNITTTGTTGSDRGYIRKKIPAQAGETLHVSFKAILVSGNAIGGIDYPTVSSLKSSREIVSEFWQQYDLTYTASDINQDSNYFQVVLGHITGYEGTVSITDVVIRLERSKLPVARCYCAALITINDGTAGKAEVNSNFSSIGINKAHLATSFAGSVLTIKVPMTQGGDIVSAAPIFQVAFTSDTNSRPYQVRAGSYQRSTGLLTLSFFDEAGVSVDVSGIGKSHIWITGFGV